MVNGHVYPQVDTVPTGPRYREPMVLLENQRDGTFKDISKEAGPAIQIPRVSRGMAIGDLFNDGRLEAVVENLVGRPTILRPEGGAQPSLDQLPAGGRQEQPPGPECAGPRHRRTTWCSSTKCGAAGAISPRATSLHFGLGDHEKVDKAEVLWPDGKVEILTNLARCSPLPFPPKTTFPPPAPTWVKNAVKLPVPPGIAVFRSATLMPGRKGQCGVQVNPLLPARPVSNKRQNTRPRSMAAARCLAAREIESW